ncbi:ATP-binding protein [Candidatus Leptofilum sp.]|uniref:ATP-binding protein n=1 Tax=Candidatus Leptofilum sp. TaxID=3241576 RepID=UPI003B5AD20F
MSDTLSIDSNQIHHLWQKLAEELLNIFDAHGVCAIVANETAVFSQTTTVVGVSDPQNKYFDVWVCDKDGRIQQTRWNKEHASFASFIAAGKPTVQEKFNQPPAELIRSELWQIPRDRIMAVPLPAPGRYAPVSPPGILCLIDPQDGQLLTNPDNLAALATHVTTALDRAYLRQTVDRQDIEFAVVSEISYALTSTLSLQNIYRQLMEPVRRTLNVGSVSVGLIEQPSGDIIFVDILMGELFKDLPTIRLKKGQGIAGWVSENRQSVIINDVYSDKRFYARVDRQSGFQTENMICIPLQIEDRVIGILQAINKQNGDFNENDLRLLQAIGGPLAAAIENASLHTAVLAEKRRIETIFANMSEGMMTVDADGLITHANDSLLSLLFRDLPSLLGHKANDMIRFANGSLSEFMERVLTAEEEYPQLATDMSQSGGSTVPILLSGAPIRDENGAVTEMIFVFSDLSQIREVERLRDDFFHGIIHELRTPLATILMYARLLREGKAQQKEKADRFLGVIERESDRLQKMVRQMLEVVKMEASEFQRSNDLIDLNELFDEILPPLADRATEKGLTFRQRIAPAMSPVSGNQETYHLIFKNLIDNAVKFTLSGTVRVEAYGDGGQIVVEVRDDGIGIPKQALPNLFGRFFRAQTAVERGIAGTGLGLYMVKVAVENYNGSIDVKSTAGKGTTFTVKLPIAEV